MMIVGIDPGLTGAVASLHAQRRELALWKTPVIPNARKRGKAKPRPDYNPQAMRAIIAALVSPETIFVLEEATVRPWEGVVSARTIGRGIGLWEGLLIGLGARYEFIRPGDWKKIVGIPAKSPKNTALLVAQRRFPQTDWSVCTHGAADAALIADGYAHLSGAVHEPDPPADCPS